MEVKMKENRPAAVPFILVTVFLDMMGIAIVIPVLPGLIATFTADRDAQTYWYGAMLASYGLMQFVSAPILGALSVCRGRDQAGRAEPQLWCARCSLWVGIHFWSDDRWNAGVSGYSAPLFRCRHPWPGELVVWFFGLARITAARSA